jgi:hypothetical protein
VQQHVLCIAAAPILHLPASPAHSSTHGMLPCHQSRYGYCS